MTSNQIEDIQSPSHHLWTVRSIEDEHGQSRIICDDLVNAIVEEYCPVRYSDSNQEGSECYRDLRFAYRQTHVWKSLHLVANLRDGLEIGNWKYDTEVYLSALWTT